MWYLLGFVGMVLSLTVWLYRNAAQRPVRGLPAAFVLSLAAYVLGLLFLQQGFGAKLGLVARDLLVVAGAGLAVMALSAQRQARLPGLVTLALLVILYFYTKAWPSAFHSNGPELDANAELLIQLKEGGSLEALQRLRQRYGLDIEPAFQPGSPDITQLDDYYTVNVPPRYVHRLGAIERALYRSGAVVWAEPNEMVTVKPLPAPAPAPGQRQYGLNDPGLSQLWGFEAMQVAELYQMLRDGKVKPQKKALIAILDTGVDAAHEDLAGNYRSLKQAYDTDPMGHGTHCAGIAAAVSNNGKGIASFSTDNSFFQVSSIRVLGAGGAGSQQGIIRGMLEAADAGADVISMSLGGRVGGLKSNAYEKAVQYAAQKGAIVVAAAGNANRNAREFAPVNTPGVIGVSAINSDLDRAEFSNYVSDIAWAVAAPGVGIYSTIPKNQYATYNGTSMATPYVAGLLALMKSVKPDLAARDAWQILHDSGKETRQTSQTGRLVQPARAIQLLTR